MSEHKKNGAVPGLDVALQRAQQLIADEWTSGAPVALDGEGGEPVVYDKGSWHSEFCADHGLDQHQAHVHTGMFITWLIDRDFFRGEHAEDAPQVKARTLTGPWFYERALDGALLDEMLTEEGNAFAQAYFDLDSGTYLADYAEVFAIDESSPTGEYAVEDTWENYDKLRPRIDERYEAFRAARATVRATKD